ncbi:oxygen-dependent coproporphyrinogen oxidase [Cryomorpha ignava]|uniref:coproporphyrinogen oxidase n=1 Tax=Cryomorpha ignava TaxID=101383 RepID=A0A7K3WSH7_9FLAO|nr:oxygen-dependent coproporphyrinogen oxidase [Cryomorpha ignava]NEN24434.1 oxygen-dependent coproporphyrinogen oxidase [Cryomorpha ignava]
MPDKETIETEYRRIQLLICDAIEKADGKGKFEPDSWDRPEGGGGLTRVLSNGNVLEKAGVNFSAVYGDMNEAMQKNLKVSDANTFFATGVSIVMHPKNPHVPIIHMNIRYFEMDNGAYWFGGGIDLTPHYVVPADAEFFHDQLKQVCDKYDRTYYARFKKWADDYFYIPHREETRGVGGIFYDHLIADENHSKQSLFDFSIALGELFSKIYSHFLKENGDKPFTAAEKEWQFIRRGRYVEFNLVYDRGTRFGLLSNGRTESILMSLPQEAKWFYNHQPEKGSREAETLNLLKKGIDWVK